MVFTDLDNPIVGLSRMLIYSDNVFQLSLEQVIKMTQILKDRLELYFGESENKLLLLKDNVINKNENTVNKEPELINWQETKDELTKLLKGLDNEKNIKIKPKIIPYKKIVETIEKEMKKIIENKSNNLGRSKFWIKMSTKYKFYKRNGELYDSTGLRKIFSGSGSEYINKWNQKKNKKNN